jgi:NDP-sugar pyrophosphorylase family protein
VIELGLIPAAGAGVRAYPKSQWIPKPLLEVGGRTLIERNVAILRDQLGIRRIVVVVGHLGEQIREVLGDGKAVGVELEYVRCDDPGVGLARGMLLAEPILDRPFVTLLADELYLGSNHGALEEPAGAYLAVCGIHRTADRRSIQKNYSVALEDDRIVGLVEKPVEVDSDLLGCGTYLFSPAIFDRIRDTPPSPRSGRVELTDVIGRAAEEGEPVLPFFLAGEYVNVNSVEDYNSANYLARSLAFPEATVVVVIPTFREEETIGEVVHDFLAHPKVREVVVVDNSSPDRTASRAREAGARVELVSAQGYGDTIRGGLDHAQGDIVVVTEADHSFRSRDLGKLLEYLKDADMVIGTRTTRELIEQGANMQGVVRWANVLVGKLIEALWWGQEPRFTDVGCTFRALWPETWRAIRERTRGTGPEFAPEMMIEVLRARRRVLEVPVSYFPRSGGESKHSQSFIHLARTALRMLALVFRKRLGFD